MAASSLSFNRVVKSAAGLKAVRGNLGYLGDALISRDALVSGTYDACDYAGAYSSASTPMPDKPAGTTWDSRRVGFFGWDTITNESIVDSNLTYTVNGQTILNTVFYRRISVSAKDVTFINCVFLGSLRENNAMVTSSNANCENLTFIDCTFAALAPQQSTLGWKGIAQGTLGHRFIRCDFYGTGDLVGNSGFWDKMTAIQCAFHDQAYFSPDYGAAGGIDDNATHTDNFQFRGAAYLKLEGNSFRGFYDGRYASDMDSVDLIVPETRPSTDKVTYVIGADRKLHMGGNKYYDAGGTGRLCNTSCIMTSPATDSLGVISITRNYWNGGASACINLSTYTTAGSFDFSDNMIGGTRRDAGPTWGSSSMRWKAFIANNPMKAVITTNNNRRIEDGTLIAKNDLFIQGALP